MSYTKTYHDVVHYSGSVSYSYPPSEHGGRGSVSYSGSVPVSFDVTVDTDPFDDSLNKTNRSLLGVSSAVGLMEGAQVAAIKDMGDRVASTAINGFFKMIGSDLSQEISAGKSAITARLGAMLELGKSIDGKKDQLEGDYRNISSHFYKTFQSIDDECKRAVVELDKSAYALRTVSKNLLFDSYKKSVGFAYQQELDSSETELYLSIARLRSRAGSILDTIKGNVVRTSLYQKNMEKIRSQNLIEEGNEICMPVVYYQSSDDTTMHYFSKLDADTDPFR